MRSRVVLGLAWLVGTVASALVVWEGLSYEPESDRLRGSSVAGASAAAVPGSGGVTRTSVATGAQGAISQVEAFTPGSASGAASSTAPMVTGIGDAGTAGTTAPVTVGTPAPTPVPPAPTTSGAPPAGAPEPAPAPAPTSESTFALVGGVAGVRFSATGVEVLWATPNAGFAVEIEPEGPGRKVEFRSGGHRSRLDVWWQDGPRHAISEKAD